VERCPARSCAPPALPRACRQEKLCYCPRKDEPRSSVRWPGPTLFLPVGRQTRCPPTIVQPARQTRGTEIASFFDQSERLSWHPLLVKSTPYNPAKGRGVARPRPHSCSSAR